MSRTGSRRRAGARTLPAAVPLALALALTLGACTAEPAADGRTDTGAEAGYVSGDGSTRTWAPEDRGDAVVVAGTDFSGAPVSVADWRGDVVVLNTWYAACPPCRAEAPDLVALATDYADRGVHLLGINGTDDAGAAQAFERTFSVPYPSLADTDGTAIASLQGEVPLQAVPTTVVLDREGRVAGRVLGLADGSTLRAMVDDLLAEPAPAGV
ncbi:TlpA family protein disulfide reductase [Cellulomonas aerilata]|uniref:Thiol-disulfide isomerase n=1 Tax=Cellulomonas aerilata TaxID=515326 RepID=A0A512D8G1_9CELL|nr:TlpA disulfide reductase family protein [Cellulomonas aerilata]GEO32774.1 thiol-disulfide isomerase [Cellulomonas aerilata]